MPQPILEEPDRLTNKVELMRKRVMVDMSTTLLHHGHIRLLAKAAELGDVVVALSPDEFVSRVKGYTPELNYDMRKEILESIKYVKEVVPYDAMVMDDQFLDRHNCDLLIHGDDNTNHVSPQRLVIFPRTQGISSSYIRERVLSSLLEILDTNGDEAVSKIVAEFMINCIKSQLGGEKS